MLYYAMSCHAMLCCPTQSLKLLSSMSDEDTSCAQQLAAQVYFRLDRGKDCVAAYERLKAAGQVGGALQHWVCSAVVLAGSIRGTEGSRKGVGGAPHGMAV